MGYFPGRSLLHCLAISCDLKIKQMNNRLSELEGPWSSLSPSTDSKNAVINTSNRSEVVHCLLGHLRQTYCLPNQLADLLLDSFPTCGQRSLFNFYILGPSSALYNVQISLYFLHRTAFKYPETVTTSFLPFFL